MWQMAKTLLLSICLLSRFGIPTSNFTLVFLTFFLSTTIQTFFLSCKGMQKIIFPCTVKNCKFAVIDSSFLKIIDYGNN
jgi:hypothetical protein